MKNKGIFVSIIICLIVGTLFLIEAIYKDNYLEATESFLVYLDGKQIGMINDKSELYEIINNEQLGIKNKYRVDNVYPPSGFDLVSTNSYDESFISEREVYDKISEKDDFTIKGYVIKIKFKDEDKKEITINVLDKKIFDDALNQFILSFVTEEQLNAYLNGNRSISEIGSVIRNMYFDQTITIQEAFISVKEDIFMDSESLSQYLLFGPNAKMSSYTVKYGDTIESISENNKLNPREFIVANPIYKNTNSMLEVGKKVNITLLNPVLDFIYEIYRIEESTTRFNKKIVIDKTKPANYSEITQSGVTGLTRNYEKYNVVNGEQSWEIKIEDYVVLREPVDQITTVGQRQIVNYGTYVDNGKEWGWPTNQPYVISSYFGYRWGKIHGGLDISGTGLGSNIYAAGDGVVVAAEKACIKCTLWTNGTYVVIDHGNNEYTVYAHLSNLKVKAGDVVKKGTVIGGMGSTGYSTGVHLHFGYHIGKPFSGEISTPMNPLTTIFK